MYFPKKTAGLLLVLALASPVLAESGLEIALSESISREGVSARSVTFSFNEALASDVSSSFAGFCASILGRVAWEGETCAPSGNSVVLTGRANLSGASYYSAIDSLFETTYMYNAASSDAFVSEVLGFMDLSPEKLAELQGGGVEVTYSVQTPGGKYSASALQALSGGPEAVFYSKEFRLVNLAVAGLLALGLLFLGAKRFNAFGKGKTAGGAPSNLSRGSGKSKGHVKPGRKKAAMVFLLIALSPLAQGQFTPQPVDVSAFAFTGSPTAFNTHGFSAAEYLWDSIRVSVEPDLHEKALIATEVVGERVAEASAALSSGNVTPELAASASLALQSAGFTTQSVLQQIQSSPAFEGATSPGAAVEGAATQQEEVASAVNQLTAAALSVGQHAQDLHETVKSQVATGAISGEAAAFLDFGSVESATSEVQASLGGEVRSQLIEGIASTQGVPVVEAELFYESGFQASGLGAASTQDIQEELPVIAEKIAEVERQLADAKEQGLILSNAVALTEMVEQAKIKLQETQNALEGDRLGRAFGDLSAAEHLILNADRFIDFEFVQEGITPEGLLPGELAALQEEAPEDVFTEVGEFQERVDSIETQRFEEEKQHAEDYEAFKEELKQKYPDRADYFDEEHARAEKVTALTDEFSGRYEGEVSALQAEGRTGEEAAQIVSEKFADEYRKAYGEPFLPPGFVIEDNFQFVAAGADAERNVGGQVISEGAGGGFLIGTQYDDPASGYKYEFTETGWRFTTPTGQAYEESYPEGYEPPTAFQNGNEEYTYSIETPEGVVEYTYTPTGYEVVTPDGGREAFAYTPGEYKLPDGRSVEYTPTGYELQSTDGVDARYDYNPEFQTYVSTDGTIYTPEQGVTPHYNTEFDSELGDYTYDYGSDTWTFDSDAGAWVSPDGEAYQPPVDLVAPVGYESQESFTTPEGTEWNWNNETSTWESDAGDTYDTGEGTFDPATGAEQEHVYNYDSRTFDHDTETGDYRVEVSTFQGIGEWTYNSQLNAWARQVGDAIETVPVEEGAPLVPPQEYPTPFYPTPGFTGPPVEYTTPGFVYQTPYYTYPSPSYAYPTPGEYPTPSYLSPTAYQYPTPGEAYPTPYYSYPSPGQYYQSPTYYQYPTPGEAYPTPAYTYPSPYYAYPTPSRDYPTPTYSYPSPNSYPSPSYSYPTPGIAYSYPTPSIGQYSYPTPFYQTPYQYPTPGGAYPTPYYYQSPTYYSYPTPSDGSTYSTPVYYSYPSPSTGEYPTPSYPSPSFEYPTPSYPSPSGIGYQYPSPGTVYSYPSPGNYPYPTPHDSYPSPSGYTYPSPAGNYSYPSPSYLSPTTYQTPYYSYPSPSGTYAYPTPAGGEYPYPTPGGTYAYPTPYVTPGDYPTPFSYSYPSPSGTYVTPSYAYPSPGGGYVYPSPSYSTPGTYPYPTPFDYHTPYSYPSPGYSYPTPGGTYATPAYNSPYSYPSPGGGYPYPTPSYIYPSPDGSYSYPSPYAYPSPSYPSPGSYSSPYSYPTPGTYSYPSPSYTYPSPDGTYSYPSPYPSPEGGYTYPSPSYPSPYSYPSPSGTGYSYPSPYAYPTPGGTGYAYPSPYPYPTPGSYSYPSPYSYPTPGSYPSPSYSTPGTYSTPYSYPTPSDGTYVSPYQYPTPSDSTYSYPTPYAYPSPSTYSYPTPYGTPEPGYSYPTPSYSSPYSYPTPGSYAYPSPYSYPTPGSYATPYAYPTPSDSYSYPSPYSYPTPSSYSYPSPYGTPGGGYEYPSPYGSPSSYEYPSPYGTPYDYPSPYATPYDSPYSSPYDSPYSTPA